MIEAPDPRVVLCQSCRARIVFLATHAGRRKMPVNAETVALADEYYDSKKHKSHFATCPDAARFRKPR